MKQNLLLIITILLFSCSGNSQTKKIIRKGVFIEYPSNWVEMKMPGHEILIRQPNLKEWSVRATFDVEIHDNVDDLDKYIEDYKVQMKDYAKNFTVLSDKKIKFKENDAIELTCMGIIQGLPMKWKTVMLIKNGKLYKFTTTNMVGQYEETEPVTEKIFNSIKIMS